MLRCHIHIYTSEAKPDNTKPQFCSKPGRVDNSATSMSVGKRSSPSASRRDADKIEEEVEGGQNGGADVVQESRGGKKAVDQRRRYGRCFSGLELSVGPGPLKDVDAGKLKGQIRKWARAVVAYARQLSFGSPRSSPRMSSDGATPRSKSGLGSARGDDPPRAQPP